MSARHGLPQPSRPASPPRPASPVAMLLARLHRPRERSRLRLWIEREHAIAELEALTDRELVDIGLHGGTLREAMHARFVLAGHR